MWVPAVMILRRNHSSRRHRCPTGRSGRSVSLTISQMNQPMTSTIRRTRGKLNSEALGQVAGATATLRTSISPRKVPARSINCTKAIISRNQGVRTKRSTRASSPVSRTSHSTSKYLPATIRSTMARRMWSIPRRLLCKRRFASSRSRSTRRPL